MSTFLESILASSIVFIVFILISALIVYFANSKNVKGKKEHFKNLHQNLKSGNKVEFSQGLMGEIVAVYEDTVDIKVKSGAVVEVSRYAISNIIK